MVGTFVVLEIHDTDPPPVTDVSERHFIAINPVKELKLLGSFEPEYGPATMCCAE